MIGFIRSKRVNMSAVIKNNYRSKRIWNILQLLIIATASFFIYIAKQENLFVYIFSLLLCVIRFFTCPYLGEKNLLKMIFNTYLFFFGILVAWEPPVSKLNTFLFLYLSILIPIFDLFRLNRTQKSKTIALALCLFLGWCGGHKFYLRKDSAWLYLIFFWTGIPALIAIWDFIIILFCNTDCLATNREDRLQKVLSEYAFENSKMIEVNNDLLILFDDKKNKMMFFYDNPYAQPEVKIINYDDIIDYELCTKGNSKLQGRGIASFTGAVITDTLGLSPVAGAVIGSVSGDRKMLQSVNSIIVNLQINNLQNPFITVTFLDREVDKSDSDYRKALLSAQNFIATLAYAKNKRPKTRQ